MGNGYGFASSDETVLRDTILEIRRRLSELEALDGTQIYDTVQNLKKLVQGLIEQTDVNVSGSVVAAVRSSRADGAPSAGVSPRRM